MKIGVFDSGLGGLVITKAFIDKMPEYDYVYYGDTSNLPYGEKTSGQILSYSLEAMKFLISQDCKIIVIACNTANCVALRYIQKRFIPTYAKDVKVLGVVIPTAEESISSATNKIGVIATSATTRSHIYNTEIHKIKPDLSVEEIASPLLVPMIENNNFEQANELIAFYARQFHDIDSLILGCTHYPLVKKYFREYWGDSVKIVSQDELMSNKLKDYFFRHPEIESKLNKNSDYKFLVSNLNEHYQQVASRIFSKASIQERK